MTAANTTNILKALADDMRLSIVRNLAQHSEPVSSCTIVESCSTFLKLSQPAMSHHFNKLVDAGVITEKKVGKSKTYEVNTELLLSVGIDASKL
jgi:DNA-binding transcriptional ArsR family regulator